MKTVAAILPLALLASCKQGTEPAPEKPPTHSQTPLDATPTSIMRPDLAPRPDQAPPLEPLQVVIGFPDGGAEISPTGIEKLEKLLESPQVKQGGALLLGAHSDSGGSDNSNLTASRQRGGAVRDWLIANGIAKDRISLIAFGEQNPMRPNALPDGKPDEAGRAANRRVEIHVSVAHPTVEEQRVPTLAEEIVERTEPQAESLPAGDKTD